MLNRIRGFKKARRSRKGEISIGKISTGLVGVNGWGKQYVDILRKDEIFDLRVCFDINEEILGKICSSVDCLKANSFEELLDTVGLQAVIIATPNHLHYEQCIKSIEKGKHVFIEKPIANTSKEAKRICQAAQEENIVVSVGHNVRRRPEFRKMKEFIDKGEIGDVVMVEATNSQPIGDGRERSWRLNKNTCPSGPLLQLGIHHIDTFHYLFGEIAEVKSFRKDHCFQSEVPDTILSIIRFKSGLLGYLGTSYISRTYFEMTVYGTKGILIVMDNNLFLQKDGKMRAIKTKFVNTIEEQIKEFGECILNNREPEVGMKEAINNIIIVESIMESTR